jgi:hypothetical protein
MNILLSLWDYESKDSFSVVWRSVVQGVCIGVTEGMIIYILLKATGVFDNIPIYG